MASALAALMAQHVVSAVGGRLRALVADRRTAAMPRFRCARRRPRAAASVHTRPSRSIGPDSPHRPVPLDGGRVRASACGSSIHSTPCGLLLHEAAKPEPDGQGRARGRCAKCCPPSRSGHRPGRAPGCMRGTSRRPPASASSRSWRSSCWRPAPPSGLAMRRGSSNWPTADRRSAPGQGARRADLRGRSAHEGSKTRSKAGFCFRGRRLSAEPWFPVPWPILDPPDVGQLTREARDAEYEELPDARPGESVRLARVSAGPGGLRRVRPVRTAPCQSARPGRRPIGAVREWPRGRAGCADDHPVLARGPDLRAPAPTNDRKPSGTG